MKSKEGIFTESAETECFRHKIKGTECGDCYPYSHANKSEQPEYQAQKPCEHQRADYRSCPHCMGIGTASPKPDAPAREWWIVDFNGYQNNCGGSAYLLSEGPPNDPDEPYIHVIEKSAYDEVIELSALDNAALCDCQIERDALANRVAELEESLKYQKKIIFQQSEKIDWMSKTTVGQAIEELTAAKAESIKQADDFGLVVKAWHEKLTQANQRIKELETESQANFKSAESWKEQALEKFDLMDAITDAKEREQRLVAALEFVSASVPNDWLPGMPRDELIEQLEFANSTIIQDAKRANNALKAHNGGA